MTTNTEFDAIIIGGSYSGLSAAMALGRALRSVLIIDSGRSCNHRAPHSHNFITQDGKTPNKISGIAKQQVQQYPTVQLYDGLATDANIMPQGFAITTQNNNVFKARKIIFATGLKDIMPNINGFSECWGISIIHCPYCHGYEIRNEKTGILANGAIAFHYALLISNWSKDLTIFTNGKPTFTQEQTQKIKRNNILIIEKKITSLEHNEGQLENIVFSDKSIIRLKAIYAKPYFEQHCKIPEKIGCEITEQGILKVDMFQETTVKDIFACGDTASPLRAISYAIATGSIAGSTLNNRIIEDEF